MRAIKVAPTQKKVAPTHSRSCPHTQHPLELEVFQPPTRRLRFWVNVYHAGSAPTFQNLSGSASGSGASEKLLPLPRHCLAIASPLPPPLPRHYPPWVVLRCGTSKFSPNLLLFLRKLAKKSLFLRNLPFFCGSSPKSHFFCGSSPFFAEAVLARRKLAPRPPPN